MHALAEDMIREAVARALHEPGWFFRDVLCFSVNLNWQEELAEAVLDVRRKADGEPTRINHEGKPRITVRAGHGPGKTFALAAVAHLWSFTTYGLVAVTAPKEQVLRTRFFVRYRHIRAGAAPWYRALLTVGTLNAQWCKDENWGIQGETASEPENLAGYHDTPQLFLIDEASGRRMDPMFPTIEGALSTPGSVLLEIGNPTRTSGEFYAHHSRAALAPLYHRVHVRPEDAPGIVSPQWVDNMARKYGRESAIFKVRVLGEFAPMDENQLIQLEWIEHRREEDVPEALAHLPRLRIAVDVADGGANETVFSIAHHTEDFKIIRRIIRKNYPPALSTQLAADEAERLWEEWGGRPENGDDLVVDGLGVGAGTAGALLRKGLPVVVYKGGEASDDSKQWRNRRTQSYLVLRDEFRDGRIYFDENTFVGETAEEDWEDLIAQVSSVRRREGTERLEDIETKKDLLARGVASPDIADNLAMQCATQAPQTFAMLDSEPVIAFDLETANYENP